MQKLIIIKYGEMTTKKDNINLFIRTLKDNIKAGLKNSNIKSDRGRMYIYSDDIKNDISKLQNIFGIHEINIGYEIEGNDFEDIKNNLITIIENIEFKTFKVETKRSNKSFPISSMEVSKILGGLVLKNKDNVTVDVHYPEIIFTCEIRQDKSYLYDNALKGLGGYPVGTLGKGLLMLSGGIDSPVAGYMALKRGVKLEAIYFESIPHTSIEARNKVQNLAKCLVKYGGNIKLHVVSLTEIQEAIYKNIPHEYIITILRRMMYRIAEKIAHRRNCKIIINGESIGQVASQTLTSMSVINEVVKIPVIRPLACFDKNEIIAIAKEINTYETSILPFQDCCTIFVPKHPVINPELDKCYEYETLISYEEMIREAIKNKFTIDINDNEDNIYEELL